MVSILSMEETRTLQGNSNEIINICRPDFLKTPDHPLGLELDIYYPQYGFAIEVQGIQHKCFHAFFHKNQKILKNSLHEIS
jgi:hypothetical protein